MISRTRQCIYWKVINLTLLSSFSLHRSCLTLWVFAANINCIDRHRATEHRNTPIDPPGPCRPRCPPTVVLFGHVRLRSLSTFPIFDELMQLSTTFNPFTSLLTTGSFIFSLLNEIKGGFDRIVWERFLFMAGMSQDKWSATEVKRNLFNRKVVNIVEFSTLKGLIVECIQDWDQQILRH